NETTENETLEIVYKTQLSTDDSSEMLGGALSPDGNKIFNTASDDNLYMYEYDGGSWTVSEIYENYEDGVACQPVEWEGDWIVSANKDFVNVYDTVDTDNFEDWNKTDKGKFGGSLEETEFYILEDGYLLADNYYSDDNLYIVDVDNESLPIVNEYDISEYTGEEFNTGTYDDYDGYVFVGTSDDSQELQVFEYLGDGELSHVRSIDTPFPNVYGLKVRNGYIAMNNAFDEPDVGGNVAVLEFEDGVESGDVSVVDNFELSSDSIDCEIFGDKVLFSKLEGNAELYNISDNLTLENEYGQMYSFHRREMGDGEGRLIAHTIGEGGYENTDVYSYEF
ncbi:MAG: hypothetical protein ACOCP8_07375, partial [archaeon]